jgi:flagellar hook assembly protein FlgD
VKKATPTSVGNEFLPVTLNLFQNYPNPFNPSTVISYSIPNVSYVSLKIYDILGREVKTLINSEQNIGIHNVQWNGDNNYGNKVSSGIYLYRIEAGNFIMTKKMILLK